MRGIESDGRKGFIVVFPSPDEDLSKIENRVPNIRMLYRTEKLMLSTPIEKKHIRWMYNGLRAKGWTDQVINDYIKDSLYNNLGGMLKYASVRIANDSKFEISQFFYTKGLFGGWNKKWALSYIRKVSEERHPVIAPIGDDKFFNWVRDSASKKEILALWGYIKKSGDILFDNMAMDYLPKGKRFVVSGKDKPTIRRAIKAVFPKLFQT